MEKAAGEVAAVCGCDADDYCSLHVGCDDDCRALLDPAEDDSAEVWKTMVHYRDHGFFSGCSHGC